VGANYEARHTDGFVFLDDVFGNLSNIMVIMVNLEDVMLVLLI
jgi:hypothetical protein